MKSVENHQVVIGIETVTHRFGKETEDEPRQQQECKYMFIFLHEYPLARSFLSLLEASEMAERVFTLVRPSNRRSVS